MTTQASYDHIIIGAGSAGGMLCYRLSRDPNVRVLLIEAGPHANHWTTTLPAGNRFAWNGPRNWGFVGEPEPHMNNRRLDQPRGKCLGGSSSLNGMVFVRGHRGDFAAWPEGWHYDDVLPFYKSMETWEKAASPHRGTEGPIHIHTYPNPHPIEAAYIQAGVQAGFAAPEDYNSDGAAQEGVCVFDANINGGVRSGTARECIRPAMRRPNVTVLTEAHVTRLILDGTRAVGVAYRLKGVEAKAHAGQVILSAGAFQSPQILMLSGIGPADHLRGLGIRVVADLPQVGENLQDHLEVHLKHRSPHKGIGKNKYLKPHRVIAAGIQWYLTKTGPAANGPSLVGGFFRSGLDAGYPDIQCHFWPYYLEGWDLPTDKDGYSFDMGPTRSDSRGWVRLGSADPFAAPRICLNALSHPDDLPRFRAGIRIAREIAAQPAFDFCRGPEVSPGPEVTSDDDLDAYIRANANSAYHPCGTCAIGTVVDSEARVFGIEGLRVADASIMPVITNGNINAPSLMIGERVAHMIKTGE